MGQHLNNQTDNGSASESWPGGNGTYFVEGTFDGAKVQLQWRKYKTGATDWEPLSDLTNSIGSAKQVAFYAGPCELQSVLIDANTEGTGTNISSGTA